MKFIRSLVCLAAAVAVSGGLAFAQYAASNYSAPGGADWEVGGTLNIKSGGKLTFNAVQQSGAVRIGETALGGSNPTAVTTGLSTVTGCALTIKESVAPGDNTSVLTYSSSGGTLNVYAWKNTGGTDPTLVASSGTETFGWACTGT